MLAGFLAEKDHRRTRVQSSAPIVEAVGTPPDVHSAILDSPAADTTFQSEPSPSGAPADNSWERPASNIVGVRGFVVATLAMVFLGGVGWLAFLSWSARPSARPDDLLVAEVTEEKVIAAVEPVQNLPTPAPAEPPPTKAVENDEASLPAAPETPPPDIIDAVSKPHLGEEARKAAVRAFKRNAQVIRRLCPSAVGKRIGIEALVSQSGRISWAVPVDRGRPGFKCVADNMRQVKSGSRLQKATKVRLYVEP